MADTEERMWDAIVVGSGTTGGTAALELTERGHHVLVLEAGSDVAEQKGYGVPALNLARQLYRHYVSHRQDTQKLHATYWTTNPDFFVDDVDHPYTTPEGKPFRWIRGRQLGGRSLVWDGVTPRMSDFEFSAADLDGFGSNWPIKHADLDQYYSKVEGLLGVHGSRDGLPQLPDGNFREARPLTSAEYLFRRRVEAKFPDRRVLASRGLRASRRPGAGEKHSGLSSQATALAKALATGRLTIRTGAVVTRVSLRPDGSGARGVEFIDTATKQTAEAVGRVVFLCASTIETVRLLLKSEDAGHPGGLGASSGVLGHYLMDHIASNVYFRVPGLKDDGKQHEILGSDSILIPRYQNLGRSDADHLRGFGLWGALDRFIMPSVLHRQRGEVHGFLCARSEVLPHFENRVTLDRTVHDVWGQPVPHIDCEWKPEDVRINQAARAAALEMIECIGGQLADLNELFFTSPVDGFLDQMQAEWRRSIPGLVVHEVGGARMGTKSTDSVVNAYNQVWEAPNVFVVDGACWPSCGWQNPTLTEMAISARAAAFASAELAEGRL